MFVAYTVACAAPLLVGPSFAPAAQSAAPAEMTIEQKIGQLLVLSFVGSDFGPTLDDTLKTLRPGALLFFRSNVGSPARVANLIARAQGAMRARGAPTLFTMVDQEGGAVTRVKSPLPMPSALALSSLNDAAFTRSYARAAGDVLFRLGFNVDLAPVMDLVDPLKKSFIGTRTFGSDPGRVRELTGSYAAGLNDSGLLPTAKHFPGHGGIDGDSHRELPIKDSTLGDLRASDLVPFAAFAGQAFPRAVMVAHLGLPKIEPSGGPATFSKALIGGVLREELHYDGLVVTDDLEMRGAGVAGDIGERAVRAFEAGNDLLMLAGSPANQRLAFGALVAAVRSGRITRARLDESVVRVLAAKKAIRPAPAFDERGVTRAFNGLDQLSREIMRRNFRTGVAAARRAWPAVTRRTRVLVIGPSLHLARDFALAFPGATRGIALTSRNLAALPAEIDRMREDFAVYFASGQQTARALAGLPAAARARVLVVNAVSPGEIERPGEFMSVVNMNSFWMESAGWIARALTHPPAGANLRAERD